MCCAAARSTSSREPFRRSRPDLPPAAAVASPGPPMSQRVGHRPGHANEALPGRPAPRLRSLGRVLRQCPPGPNPGRAVGGPGWNRSRSRRRTGLGQSVPDAAGSAQLRPRHTEPCPKPCDTVTRRRHPPRLPVSSSAREPRESSGQGRDPHGREDCMLTVY